MALRDYFKFPWTRKKNKSTEQKVQDVIDKRNLSITSQVVKSDTIKSSGISNILLSLKGTFV